MPDEREAIKAAKLDHCEREMFRAPSCDGCFEAGWNAGRGAMVNLWYLQLAYDGDRIKALEAEIESLQRHLALAEEHNRRLGDELYRHEHRIYKLFYRLVLERIEPETAHYLSLDALGILVGPERWRRVREAVQNQRMMKRKLQAEDS